MRYQTTALSCATLLALAACTSGAPDAADAGEAASDNGETADAKTEEAAKPADVPEGKLANNDAIFEFLTAEKYKEFPVKELERHPSVGPHDDVVVYFNQTAADSIKAGNTEHPAGSMMVKEQYKKGSDEKYGWSVSIKTHDKGDFGKGWWWYEVTSTTDPTKLYPDNPGNGVPECAACHTQGTDFVISKLPAAS